MPFSNLQTDFRGGFWSPSSQGRLDDPEYRRSLNESLNGLPYQNGFWGRRPAFRAGGFTRNGAAAKIEPLSITAKPSHDMEFTDGHIRFFEGITLLTDGDRYTVSAISGATPAAITLTAPAGWVTSDQVVFNVDTATNLDAIALITNRVFKVTKVDTTHFTLSDPVTGQSFDGSLVTLGTNVVTGAKVTDLVAPYADGDWATVNVVQHNDQTGQNAILLHGAYAPQEITIENPTVFPVFDMDDAVLIDGPYLDHPDGSWIQAPSALSGTLNLTLHAQEYDAGVGYKKGDLVHYTTYWLSLTNANIGNTPVEGANWTAVSRAHFVNQKTGLHAFAATDIGRHVRLYSQPADWDEDNPEDYSGGDVVFYENQAWMALQDFPIVYDVDSGELDVQSYTPGDDARTWVVKANGTRWTWGIITAINQSSTDITVAIMGEPLLYEEVIKNWRLGRYNATEPTWPVCGCYAGGRLWLASSDNHVDAAQAGLGLDFAPSEKDGTVTDGSAISADFDAEDRNQIIWMRATTDGIVCGTDSGEWLISAQGVITPVNREANPHMAHGSAQVTPAVTPMATVFVHKNGRTLHELFRDNYSGRLVSPTLNERSPSLTKGGIKQLAYQNGITPILWACTNEGELIGTTYQRNSLLSERPPEYNGWHHHTHGAGREFVSVAPAKSMGDIGTVLAVVTRDKGTGWHRYEVMSDPMEDTDDIFVSNYFDGFLSASSGSFYGDEGTEIEIPGTEGYWSVTGFTLSSQSIAKQQYAPPSGANTNANTATMLGRLIQNEAEDAIGIGISPATGLDNYLTPPTSLSIGVYAFTSNQQIPGIDVYIPADDATSFNIVQWGLPGKVPPSAFAAEKWFPYQHWVRSGEGVPSTPEWHEPIEGGTQIVGIGLPQGFSLHGLSNFESTLVAVFCCGLDLGDYPVVNGAVTLAYSTEEAPVADGLWTHHLVQQVSALGRDWGLYALTLDGKYNVPCVVGYRYNSRGQRLRPDHPDDAGTRGGPGFGKMRRNHQFGALLHNSKGTKFGTNFDHMNAAQFKSDGGTLLSATELFSGIYVDTLRDESSYDGMIAWENDGTPYPTNIAAIGGFIQAQDK